MQFKSVAALLLSALATGAVAQEITPPPASILTVLETALPSSLITELTNPSAIESVVSEVAAGSVPGWIQSLPPNVKSYLVTAYGSLASAIPAAESSAAALVSSALSAAATPTASAASSGSASAASSSGSSTGSSSAGHASSTSSTGGAPAATGALAMGLVGAAGVLGLAVAL